ncbi:hypothetical protein C8F04DRAFT_1276716 [Mycena alexandri]|uniref:Uncharacterized protein n=1 Tax=Mycena alexandri TaxID=1745969 RepID=A0AAD6WS91_9AGAR|nr:hypothetical protein C8F04DRAFT_1276716 [Mycena alexandri]
MVVPATDNEVTHVFMTIRRLEPSFPGFAYGFLYATGSRRRRTVAVPYNHGVEKLQSVNDLFVHAWVPKPTPSSNIVDMSVGRVVAKSMPNTLVLLAHTYYIVYVPPGGQGVHSINACGSLRATQEWAGNILVLKHGKRKPIINVDKEDSSLVDLLVSAYIDYVGACKEYIYFHVLFWSPAAFDSWKLSDNFGMLELRHQYHGV